MAASDLVKPAPVTYFIQAPLTRRDRQRFCIDALAAAGFNVRIVDFGPFTRPNQRIDRSGYTEFSDLSITTVGNKSDLIQVMLELKQSGGVVICMVAGHIFTPAVVPVLRHLKRIDIPFVQILVAEIPGMFAGSGQGPVSVARRLVWMIRDLNFWRSLIVRIPLRLLGISHAAAVFTVGGGPIHGRLIGPSTQLIECHSYDWDLVRELAKEPVEDQHIAVFLDQFFPFHPDYSESGGRPPDAHKYFGGLRRLFARIENELGLEVVVAAHPRSNYDFRGTTMFGGRRILKGDSARLVRSARLVISHHSTAIGFAAAFSKPVLLVGSQDVWASNAFIRPAGAAFADSLGCRLFSLDDVDSIDLSCVFSIDQAAYTKFVDDHLISPEIPDQPLWKFIADTFAEMYPDSAPPKVSPRTE